MKARNSSRRQSEGKLLGKYKKFLTFVFYSSIFLVASIAIFLIFYWSLRLDSSIYNLIKNTKSEPFFLWPYGFLTIGAIILFGINAVLFVHRLRKYGLPKLKYQTGSGLGSLVGVAASACPVCGSTLLSAIGITAGLAAFPLQGLELKALSFGLLLLPVWIHAREIKNPPCDEKGVCLTAHDASFQKKDAVWLTSSFILIIVMSWIGWNMLKFDPIVFPLLKSQSSQNPKLNPTGNPIYDEVISKVLPEKGYQSKIYLGNSIVKLIAFGGIDPEKFKSVYREKGGLPDELQSVLSVASYQPIHLTRENADIYVKLLWPLGLTNYMSTNYGSPVYGKSLFNFASTSGWRLGRGEEGGGASFNKFSIVPLTQEREALVVKVAQNTYRPCCNNATFYQDCNHGSALLGLLELGASQGLTEDELYREALAFNSFWFPNNYTQTALYLKTMKNIDWEKVDPKMVMSKDFSSISGWRKNVNEVVKSFAQPNNQMSVACGS